jgi:DNA-binding MarR family transcriptional regulator
MVTQPSPIEKPLRRALALTETLRQVNPELGVQTFAVFLVVALEPGLAILEVGDKLGLTQSAVSRNCEILSTEKVRRRVTVKGKTTEELQPGLGLIEKRDNPMDKRRKELYLTAAGRKVVNAISDLLG